MIHLALLTMLAQLTPNAGPPIVRSIGTNFTIADGLVSVSFPLVPEPEPHPCVPPEQICLSGGGRIDWTKALQAPTKWTFRADGQTFILNGAELHSAVEKWTKERDAPQKIVSDPPTVFGGDPRYTWPETGTNCPGPGIRPDCATTVPWHGNDPGASLLYDGYTWKPIVKANMPTEGPWQGWSTPRMHVAVAQEDSDVLTKLLNKPNVRAHVLPLHLCPAPASAEGCTDGFVLIIVGEMMKPVILTIR